MLSQMLRLPLKPGQYRSVADTEKLNKSYTPLLPHNFLSLRTLEISVVWPADTLLQAAALARCAYP